MDDSTRPDPLRDYGITAAAQKLIRDFGERAEEEARSTLEQMRRQGDAAGVEVGERILLRLADLRRVRQVFGSGSKWR